MKALQRTVPPASMPVTLAEVKASARVTHSYQDTMLTSLILAAVEAIEDDCNRAIITQTWKLTADYLSDTIIPRPPLQSISSIKYINENGEQQTLASTVYQVDTAHEPGKVSTLPGQMWAMTGIGYKNAVEVTFIAGYGLTSASVPEKIRQAIIALVVHWYDKGISEVIPDGIRRALDNYRVHYEL